MKNNASILCLYAVTPCHAGSGASVGVVDLPIQREAHTDWPCVYGSAVKGALRAHAEQRSLPAASSRFLQGYLARRPDANTDQLAHARLRCRGLQATVVAWRVEAVAVHGSIAVVALTQPLCGGDGRSASSRLRRLM